MISRTLPMLDLYSSHPIERTKYKCNNGCQSINTRNLRHISREYSNRSVQRLHRDSWGLPFAGARVAATYP